MTKGADRKVFKLITFVAILVIITLFLIISCGFRVTNTLSNIMSDAYCGAMYSNDNSCVIKSEEGLNDNTITPLDNGVAITSDIKIRVMRLM